MKLGFVTAILADCGFEEMIDTASRLGYKCVEVACWPAGKAERRYAGVSHIDVEGLTDEKAAYILDYCAKKGVEISSLAYYPNYLDGDAAKAKACIEHFKKVIAASAKLGVGMVTTFIGRDQNKTVEENLELVKQVWPPLLKLAADNGVRIAIENCPMLFGPDQWPGGQNLMTSPDNWKKVFEILPDANLGINYDPSHFLWQMIDPVKPVYQFGDKIFHVHFKDIRVYRERLDQVGITAYPLDYMAPKLPGLGDMDWAAFVSALNDVGYDGYACVEVEDRAFEGSAEKILQSLELSKRYLEQFVI